MTMTSLRLADFIRVVVLLSACSGFTLCSGFAQAGLQGGLSGAAAVDSGRIPGFTFEVVSIRPSNAGARGQRIIIEPNGDEYRALAMPLGRTILFAYFPLAIHRRERLSGAPRWIWEDRFDFVARVPPEDLQEWHKSLRLGFGEPNPMLQAMLQAALADRCRLRVHGIPTTVPGFALVMGNHGLNPKRFSVAKRDEIIPENALKIPGDGRMVPILSSDDPILHFYDTSTASLAATMSTWGAPVQDRTGLIGKYDFALTRLSTIGDPSVDWDIAALGLQMKPIKLASQTIVIDHIEYPSPN